MRSHSSVFNVVRRGVSGTRASPLIRPKAASISSALAGLARTYAELGQNEKAIQYYQMWLKAEPNNKEARQGLEKAKAAVTK